MHTTPSPGRSCPLHYHYGPQWLRQPPAPPLHDLDVLYVVGGVYGNEQALNEVLRLFAAETGRKRLVFNGDFHWFDIDPAIFARVQRAVLAHTAIRGNVETELSDASPTDDAGCGCAYPEWVDDVVVQRSNGILKRLWSAATPEHRQQLAALPMGLTASVAGWRIAIVHGDAQSLAGWGFAQEHLLEPAYRAQARAWFEQAQVDAFACTHTCLPVFQRVALPAAANTPAWGWVLNNGAAGMPNFAGDAAGLLTRVARTPPCVGSSRAGVVHQGIYLDALAIEADATHAQQAFVAQWPQGSDAHASYMDRIAVGPNYHPHQVIRLET